MKTIGILGGMSAESTVEYYRLINKGVNQRLGGHNIAETLIAGVNFGIIHGFIMEERWDEAARYLSGKAAALETAGADLVILATNTMHIVAPAIEEALSIPFLHIVDVTAEALKAQGVTKAGILGTKATMEAPFYAERFRDMHGISLVAPNEADRQEVNRIIFDELCRGRIEDESRDQYLEIMAGLEEQGAQGIILGCTEIPLLVTGEHYTSLPLYDTTMLHARAAVEACLVE